MDIPKTTPYSLQQLDRRRPASSHATKEATESPDTVARRFVDRRFQPDRRQRQRPFKGPDRRRQATRRRATLLHHRDGRPVQSENRQGGLVDTSV
ncbi:hypothetical protein CF392_04360 [Tamilnaduibacter salinus]|uniref:Uncharacterized protein n=1 Tax=Tamilnaduibacter salinus TaxID=1484056 RepID=A0A2A2I6F1_9GAMM|nr:hypothetical protein [Tamilnaduibacter salinus]PAV26705.1 hypothetical protein CF392_04360 [Tamilnaduibacter salinus]